MSFKTKLVSKWTSGDFMAFISSLNIKGNPYSAIKNAMDENGLTAQEIMKAQPADIKDLFGINVILAKRVKREIVKLNIGQKGKPAPRPTPCSNANPQPSASPNPSNQFQIHLRGQKGKRVTLRRLFTKESLISDVAQAYKDEEGTVNSNWKVEKITLTGLGVTFAHKKTLGSYGIVNSKNLISVVFKQKGGSDEWASRTVDEWDTDDLKSWAVTLGFEVADERRIISAITQNGFGGVDLIDAEVEDIADALGIEAQLAQKFYDGLRNWKVIPADVSSTSSSNEFATDATVISAASPPLPYFVGYKLDCKDSKNIWCVAEVIDINGDSITIKYINWENTNTQSGCYEDTFDRARRETHCKEYGIMTSKSNKNNVHVYTKKRRLHPSKKEAKATRDSQKQHLQTMTNKKGNNCTEAQSSGFFGSVASWWGYSNGNDGYNNNYGYGYGYNNNRNNVSGIIGLANLGNQCYMNSAIQLIVCTPPLSHLFRSTCNPPRKSLLCQFVNLSKKAQYESVYRPSAIKSILAQEDHSSFDNYSQQDSGHALSVLLEKLDRELLNNEVHRSSTINCTFADGLDKDSEQVLIEQIMDEYNPKHRSVIRDSMTFILRETYQCMTPNCDYLETRYNYVQKLVLPLENHSVRIPVTIYSTKASKSIQNEFICLSYCTLETLTVQIHQYLRKEYKKQYNIDLYFMQYDHRNAMNTILDPKQILNPLDLSKKCGFLVGKSVFVVAKRLANDDDDTKEAEDVCMDNMTMKQLYIGIDNRGKVNGFDFNAVTATIDTPVSELPITISKPWMQWIYYQGQILLPNDTATVQKSCDVMVIIYTKAKNNRSVQLVQYEYQNIDPHWKFLEAAFHKNIINYCNVSEGLRSMRQKSNSSRLRNKCVDYMTVDESLQFAIDQYAKMAQNQKLISKYLSSALQFACAGKCTQIHPKPLRKISDCLMTYFETQVLDGGASISCTQCGQCKIFKQSTTIVRYPEICTILLDRFDDGRKYDQKVEFHKTMDTICNGTNVEYELYGVCNHRSSSTDFGHYYSYVKSVDKNDSIWYEANDRTITPIRREKQITDNRNALVLMYQLHQNKSVRM